MEYIGKIPRLPRPLRKQVQCFTTILHARPRWSLAPRSLPSRLPLDTRSLLACSLYMFVFIIILIKLSRNMIRSFPSHVFKTGKFN